ncbi:hypothetical protein ISR94_03865 [Candidatus Microgenomates bacterium]|nr:hypothetical protein [Candidatus Microgenomates bacterium]
MKNFIEFVKKNKKVIIYIVILLAIIIFSVYLSTTKTTKEEKIVLSPPKPDISKRIDGNLPISFNISVKDFSIPEKLPFLKILFKKPSEDESQDLAKRVGITTAPNIFRDANKGIKYYWNTIDYSLIITPQTSVVKYFSNSSKPPATIDKNLTEKEVIERAKNFTENILSINKEILKAYSVVYYTTSDTSEGFTKTDKGNATLYQVNITDNSTGYNILTTEADNPLMFVQLLPDGTIYSFQGVLYQNITKGITEYPLKTYNDIIESKDRINIVNISNDYLPLVDLNIKDFNAIDINEISIFYLLDDRRNPELQPIFYLKGDVSISNSTADKASFYLPAFK